MYLPSVGESLRVMGLHKVVEDVRGGGFVDESDSLLLLRSEEELHRITGTGSGINEEQGGGIIGKDIREALFERKSPVVQADVAVDEASGDGKVNVLDGVVADHP